jgi:hypothetical protein
LNIAELRPEIVASGKEEERCSGEKLEAEAAAVESS